MFLSPLGERLGEGEVTCETPSPNLSPKGERSMTEEVRARVVSNA